MTVTSDDTFFEVNLNLNGSWTFISGDFCGRTGVERMQSMKNLGVVQFRPNCLDSGWKRWRGFGGQSLLQWVVRRATESQLLDGVIVVASSGSKCAEISEMVPSDVPVFLSERSDALGQFADALLHYSAQNVVRI